MSLGAFITIQSLYSWDDSLFDGLEVPKTLDKNTLISEIIITCSAQELLYPDWGFMKEAITVWSNERQHMFARIAGTLEAEYDPIANYDRREEWTDTNEATADTNDSVAAFNASSMVPRAESGSKTSGTGKHAGRVYGNIGVTTTQTLLEQERYVALYNAYRAIAEDFQARFCLLVY